MSSRPSLPHVPALDGLRGAAVLGVVAFHYLEGTDLRYVGGYLGVDLFFVLSGYLITSLLLVERDANGRISLTAFWVRRARRLLPALLLVLLAVSAYAKLAADASQLTDLRGDGLATLFYVANWREVVSNSSYWAMFTDPSPLQHTWSLAIEEQFYLVWPLIAWVVLGRAKRNPAGAMLVVCAIGLVASAAAQLVLYRPDTDPSRVYFGTDTRIAAILMGAALACAFRCFGRPASSRSRTAVEVLGWVGAAVLAVSWSTVDGQSAYLYQGGLLLCGVAATAVLAAATRPEGGPLARVFAIAPLRAIGVVSYGVYLWHWPLLVVLSPERTRHDGVILFLLRVTGTAAVTTASYFLVERPIRRGALAGWWGRLSAPIGVGLATVALVTCTALPPSQTTSTDTVAAALGGAGTPDSGGGADNSTTTATAPPPTTGSLPPGSTVPAGSSTTTTGPSPVTTTAESPSVVIQKATATLGRPPRVLLVGDSVAFSMAAEMIPVQTQLGLLIHSEAVIACGVARGTGRVKLPGEIIRNEAKDCHEWPTKWAAALRTEKPDIAFLVVGWPGSTERDLDGVFRKPCDPVFDAWYEGEVRLALDVLRSTGVPLAMTSVPYYRSTKAPAGNDETVDCLNRAYRAILDDVNEAEVQAGTPDRQVVTVDLAHYVCPQGRTCRTEVNGVTMRPDGLHFDGPSGTIVGTWVIAQGLAGTGLGA